MSHENSITRRDKDGKWRNYASVGKNKHGRPLRTAGKHSYKSEGEAVDAAKARSNRSNYGHGNNTIHESVKEERPGLPRRE
jgi:hypothetical protein